MVEAIKQNFPQREIADAAFRYQQEVDARQRIVVGVNDYVQRGRRARSPILRIDPALERKQIGRLRGDPGAPRLAPRSSATLAELQGAPPRPTRNLMPPILDCARARVTEGEMVEALQEVFGTYTEPPVF